jgi:endonuclease-3
MDTKAQKIADILAALYPDPPVPLDHTNPFELLVAVLLSAQCTDARVNLVTPALFQEANSALDMSTVPVETVKKHIRTCGLAPTKAKNIVALSKLLVERHDGEVPNDMKALEALPGVGHKTASVVLAQSFNVPTFPVDTHIFRLANRWGLSTGKNVTIVERDLIKTFPKPLWNDLHIQLIMFGREHCPARGHNPEICPICSWAS